jgi:hypothetical protein
MPQPRPTYPGMTTVQSEHILERIRTRHGIASTCWPVIFYRSEDLQPSYLTFEINKSNSTNRGLTTRFFDSGQLPEFIINYLPPRRYILPLTKAQWPDPPGEEIIRSTYSSTYEYVMSSQNSVYNTIDIDYVWRSTTNEYFGLELTTFWVPMNTVETAKRLVGQFIAKRTAVANAHQFRLLAEVAEMQQIRLNLVFLNVRKGTNEIITNGNVFVIPINRETAEQLHGGYFPKDYKFGSWRAWLASL